MHVLPRVCLLGNSLIEVLRNLEGKEMGGVRDYWLNEENIRASD